jgi:anti-anti-sigma regulatory factor
MPIRITEIGPRNETSEKRGTPQHHSHSAEAFASPAKQPTTMKVEGALHLQDAELLERICREVSEQTGQAVVIELSDICFIDSVSAAVLCRMKSEQGVTFKGLNLFIKKVLELADESDKRLSNESKKAHP